MKKAFVCLYFKEKMEGDRYWKPLHHVIPRRQLKNLVLHFRFLPAFPAPSFNEGDGDFSRLLQSIGTLTVSPDRVASCSLIKAAERWISSQRTYARVKTLPVCQVDMWI
jgi:hypothetical protein